jgi:hypothetical protein
MFDITQMQCNDTIKNETIVDNLFEVKLDMDELCDFGDMSTRPRVKIIQSLITKLSQEVTSVKKNFKIAYNFECK